MSRRTNDFLGCALVAVLIMLGLIFLIKSCADGTIKAPSFHHNSSYDSKQKEWEKRQERTSKQLENDIKNHAEYEAQVTCPHCNGIKNVPDLDYSGPEFRVKPCPVCNGRGWVVEKRRWGENQTK